MYRLDDSLPVDEVGGKAGSLNNLFSLKKKIDSLDVPPGFVLSSSTYKDFIKYNNLTDINIEYTNDINKLSTISQNIKNKILNANFSLNVTDQIYSFYDNIIGGSSVAVRSSAIGEDSEENSFAGQQDTYLNITRSSLISSIISCYASLFNLSAISYRASRGLGGEFEMAVVVQKMVHAESAGVSFSIDTETNFNKVVIINSNFGLGESVVSGEVEPDEYIYFKDTQTIISSKVGTKTHKTIYGDVSIKLVPTSNFEMYNYSLNEKLASSIGSLTVDIENEYGIPIDVEWAVANQKLYILQVRPITTINTTNTIKKYHLKTIEIPICTGVSVGQRVGIGKVSIKDHVDNNFNAGDILVTRITSPDWEPILKKAGGIITETGGRTCHAAIVARELGIPAIVGCNGCLDILKDKEKVTMSCLGEIGKVYNGILPYETTIVDISDIHIKVLKLPVKIKINSGFPDTAFSTSYLPTDGVGLTRLEFIISSLGVHPRALLEYTSLPDNLRKTIDEKTIGYESRVNYYIDGISNGIGKIAVSVYPNEVIVRFSDFKSNEYKALLGGEIFEPSEENPMIGYRGACRYYSDEFKESFKLECLAIKDVIDRKGLKNIAVMIPFCRTVNELLKVKEIIANQGLDNIKLYLMCEIPSNVILAEEFAEHIDGFSIGSNDLTQLVLGLDRDNSNIKHISDERDLAVKKLISKVIKKAHKKGITVGICGAAPSDHKDFAQFLVDEGIDSISVTPDAFIDTVNKLI